VAQTETLFREYSLNYASNLFACCSDIHLKTPYSTARDKDALHYTYLDTIGRPVITLRKDNLVEQHILDFEVPARWFISNRTSGIL